MSAPARTEQSPATQDSPAPPDGLHFAFALDGKGGGKRLGADAVRGWEGGEGPLWVLLDRFSDRAEAWLDGAFGLPELVREGLLAEDTRPRCVRMSEGLLMILRGVNVNPGAEPDDMVSVRMWIDAGRVICLRGPMVFALGDIRERLEERVGPKAPGEIVVQLADALTDRMREVVSNQQDMVDEIDEASLERASPGLRRRLMVPRRQAMTIRRYLAPQRDMLTRLAVEPTELLSERDRVRLREVSDELTRLVEELDLLRERTALIQEQMSAMASEQMNRTMYMLSLVATIFLPITFLTGLLGVNVAGIPGADWRWAFWALCGVLVALGLAVWAIMRRRRML